MDMRTAQAATVHWALKCFGPDVVNDKIERSKRFLEEALELVQSAGLSKEECDELIGYVYDRPVGKPDQELGGVMITTYVIAHTLGLEVEAALLEELHRVQDPDVFKKIQEKNARRYDL